MNFERAEKFRARHPAGLYHSEGDDFGWFEVPVSPTGPKLRIQAVASFEGNDWEHVSVSFPHRCPTWDEMCKVKDLFWDEEEAVVQFHPPKSEYVNVMPYCLHLWRYKGGAEFPRPASYLVGFK